MAPHPSSFWLAHRGRCLRISQNQRSWIKNHLRRKLQPDGKTELDLSVACRLMLANSRYGDLLESSGTAVAVCHFCLSNRPWQLLTLTKSFEGQLPLNTGRGCARVSLRNGVFGCYSMRSQTIAQRADYGGVVSIIWTRRSKALKI